MTENKLYYTLFNQVSCTIECLQEEIDQLKAVQNMCEERIIEEENGVENAEDETLGLTRAEIDNYLKPKK